MEQTIPNNNVGWANVGPTSGDSTDFGPTLGQPTLLSGICCRLILHTKGQWYGALMFSLMLTGTNSWTNALYLWAFWKMRIKRIRLLGKSNIKYRLQTLNQINQTTGNRSGIGTHVCVTNMNWVIIVGISGSRLVQVMAGCLVAPSHCPIKLRRSLSEVSVAFTWEQFHSECSTCSSQLFW